MRDLPLPTQALMCGAPAVALFVLLAGASAAGCQRRERPMDTLVVLNEAPLANLDPRFALTAWEVRVSRLVAPGLTAPGQPVGQGGLAQALVIQDPLTWEARLRDDVRFSDGRPVHADDVVYTFSSILDAKLNSPYRSALAEVLERVEALDAVRVRFVLKAPRASFASDLQIGVVARSQEAAGPSAFVGAGPYQLQSVRGDRVELSANRFSPRQPATPRLVLRAIRDDNARMMALFGGSGDLILNGVTPQVLRAVRERPQLRVHSAPSATITYLGFHVQDPVLRHPSVRRALAMAIDRQSLIRAKLAGQAVAADSLLDRDNPFHAPDLPPLPFDPSGAARLLDEAGYRDPDGPGPAPRFRLVWKTSNNRFRVGLVQAMARQLGAIGVHVDVRAYEFATLLHDLRAGNFQLFTLQMTDVLEPDWLRAALHSRRVPTEANGWAGLNRFRFADPEVDAWLEAAAADADEERRRALYHRVQRRVWQRLPVLPLWHEHNVLVLRRDVQGATLPRVAGLEGLLSAHRQPRPL